MLEGIDDIAWGSLECAEGSAVEVPALLRAVASGSAGVRGAALAELSGSICQVGLSPSPIYSATPQVAPFLIELVGACATAQLEQLLWVLAMIANGEGKPAIKAGCHAAIGRGLGKLLPLLDDASVLVQRRAVLTLCPFSAEMSVTEAMLSRLEREQHQLNRAAIGLALALGGRQVDHAFSGDFREFGPWARRALSDFEVRAKLPALIDALIFKGGDIALNEVEWWFRK